MNLSEEQLLLISERIDLNCLPGDLPDIAEVTGIHKALLIADRLGGGFAYLRKWTDDKSQWSDEIRRWVDTIGKESTEDVVRLFGGTYINIPNCKTMFQRYRDEIICESKNTALGLARTFHRSARQIKRIRNRREDDRQSSLFEL